MLRSCWHHHIAIPLIDHTTFWHAEIDPLKQDSWGFLVLKYLFPEEDLSLDHRPEIQDLGEWPWVELRNQSACFTYNRSGWAFFFGTYEYPP